MHHVYTGSNKVSETCYPPSLFGKSLPELVCMGSTPGVKTPITPVEVDEVGVGDGVEWLGVDGRRRLRRVRRVVCSSLVVFATLDIAMDTKS